MGGGLYFYRCKDEIYKFLRKSDKLDDIGVGGFFPTMSNWIKPIYSTLDPEICRNCKARIFSECHIHLPNGEPRSPSPQSSPANGRGGERAGQFSNSGEPRTV
jgi:SulP family sulfate permease